MLNARQQVSLLRITLVCVVLVALVAAPLCGSFCTAGVCAGTGSPTSGCHEVAAAANGPAPESNVAAVRSCNLSELPVARLSESTGCVKAKNQQTASLIPPRLAFVGAKIGPTGTPSFPNKEESPPDLIKGSSTVLRI
jgi:hypothetical protein